MMTQFSLVTQFSFSSHVIPVHTSSAAHACWQSSKLAIGRWRRWPPKQSFPGWYSYPNSVPQTANLSSRSWEK
jgi:hypothetical protein